jgi:hypothetical protein
MCRGSVHIGRVREDMKRQTKQPSPRTGQKRRSSQSTRKFVPPRTAEEYFGMPERNQERWIGIHSTVSKMRANGISLSKASRESGVDPRTVIRLGGSALRKLKNGRYATRAHDRLLRVVVVVAKPYGLLEIATRDSRQASQAGRHSAAVQRYLETGDASALAKFRGKHMVDANGKRVAFLTDLHELDRLGSAGDLSYESLYPRSS